MDIGRGGRAKALLAGRFGQRVDPRSFSWHRSTAKNSVKEAANAVGSSIPIQLLLMCHVPVILWSYTSPSYLSAWTPSQLKSLLLSTFSGDGVVVLRPTPSQRAVM